MHRHSVLHPKSLGALFLLMGLINLATTSSAANVDVVSGFASSPGSAGAGSYAPQFSTNGGTLFFLSHARNLVTNDSSGRALRLYSFNPTNQQISLVRVGPNSGTDANASIGNPMVAANGQHILFESIASNLAPNDTNASKDLFVYNLATGQTELLTLATNGTTTGTGDSLNAVITPDGRWIAFESLARDLSTNQHGGGVLVYLRDRVNGTTTLVSRDYPSSAFFYAPAVTPDGANVAFVSTASFLVPTGPGNTSGDVYVRNMQTGSLVWTGDALMTNNIPAPYRCFHPRISDDGQKVVFKVTGSDSRTYLCLFEIANRKTSILSSNADPVSVPVLSGDGRLLFSESNSNLFLWNLHTGTNLLISVDAAGTAPGNGRSYAPVVSADFSRVAFLSDSSNLTTNAVNGRVQIFLRDLASGVTRLVSADTNRIASGDFTDVAPALNTSGDLLAFDAKENNLVPNDNNAASDVFLYSWPANSLQLISREASGKTAITGKGISFAGPGSVTANGRFVAFATLDTNTYPIPTTNAIHLAVWDTWQNRNVILDVLTNPPAGSGSGFLHTAISSLPPILSEDGSTVAYTTLDHDINGLPGKMTLYSLELTTGERSIIATNRNSFSSSTVQMTPSISADGRLIAFQSDATTLANPIPDNNNRTDVFLFNNDTKSLQLLSVDHTGTNIGSEASTSPALSPDGQWVLFRSRANNLATNTPAATLSPDLQFARHLGTGKTFALADSGVNYRSPGLPVFTTNSQFAFFGSLVGSVSPSVSHIVGAELGTTNIFYACSNCANPSISANSRFLAFETTTNLIISDIYLRDFQTGKTNLVTASITGGGANGLSKHAQISPDGRYIVFSSTASNLVPNDNNGLSDIFVRDRVLGITTLLSLNQQGTGSAAGASFRPVLSKDGRTVVFQSFADDLVSGDYNTFRDVFVARLGGADTDADGLDDDWEVTYFGNLSRNGTGDSDNDGQTDYQEFLAGTDPNNTTSILRAMTVSGMNSEVVTILWTAVPGKTYRVQYKDDLNVSGWTELSGSVVATSSTASRQDTKTAGQRFYRVVADGE